MTILRLSQASLTDPAMSLEDPQRTMLSTPIASDEWLLEADWDGRSLGDLHIFRNKNAREGQRLIDHEGEPDPETGKLPYLPFKWVWFAGVPCGKIKSYYFLPEDRPAPRTLHAEPQAKPGASRKDAPKKAGPAQADPYAEPG